MHATTKLRNVLEVVVVLAGDDRRWVVGKSVSQISLKISSWVPKITQKGNKKEDNFKILSSSSVLNCRK
jgi:hypothetical protein